MHKDRFVKFVFIICNIFLVIIPVLSLLFKNFNLMQYEYLIFAVECLTYFVEHHKADKTKAIYGFVMFVVFLIIFFI